MPRHNKLRLSYCAEQVRRQDHDRFLTVLFAPQNRREALFALYAFNQELARIRETVSEPMLGEIRLQWWYEALRDIYAGQIRHHEVVQALAQAIRDHDLPREAFEQLIEARRQDLYDETLADLDSLRDYLRKTPGTLAALAARILQDSDSRLQARAVEMGELWGLVGIMRAVPYHLSLNKLLLPETMMKKYGLTKTGLANAQNQDNLQRLIAELCGTAEDQLAALRRHRKTIPARAHSLFLLASLSQSYLKSLRKAGHNPFALAERADALPRQFRLIRDGLFRRF
ncbi:phytoene/squalene synthase family protein [Luteithermobacter gelatinilyticus]|uniref:phytoene/squalene synthase family protein n=1 Tax=Luteithermobacter gelatinilyticus TaxID=2582913 RepID=UPI001106CCEA|nr:phytoene/squalene synthase family protein [Luteithermobacter gelatinilyticus]